MKQLKKCISNKSILKGLIKTGKISNLLSVFSPLFLSSFILEYLSFSLLSLCFFATLFYLGGIYLNNFFDSEFDLKFAPQTHFSVFGIPPFLLLLLSSFFFLSGILYSFLSKNLFSGMSSFFLVLFIILYDLLHKKWKWAFFFLGMCRSLLYLWGIFCINFPISIIFLLPALTLFFYASFLTWFAQKEHLFIERKKWIKRGIIGFIFHDMLWLLFFGKAEFLPFFICLLILSSVLQKKWRAT